MQLLRGDLDEYDAASCACEIHDLSVIVNRGSGRIASVKERETFGIELLTVDAAVNSNER